jgi:hypothetical protein
MRLFVEPMNATVIDIDGAGRVHIENEGWMTPNLQERRAIIYSAEREVAELNEAIDVLQEPESTSRPG